LTAKHTEAMRIQSALCNTPIFNINLLVLLLDIIIIIIIIIIITTTIIDCLMLLIKLFTTIEL